MAESKYVRERRVERPTESTCSRCGKPANGYPQCGRCYGDARANRAYNDGYRDGLDDGRTLAQVAGGLGSPCSATPRGTRGAATPRR